mgnify:FL=1
MKLISYKTKSIIVAFIILPQIAFANVGVVTQQIGKDANISRDKDTILVSEGVGINMNDTITTSKAKLRLTFEDNTKVSITQQSKLVIDDFIYDPSEPGTGKLAMNIAMGTVRYSSGAIARNNRENVRLRTPTATIAVRGTDFTMTVDEIGRSLVILLPSCPDDNPANCFTGEIEVSSEVGMVLLNQAFQATVVSSTTELPSEPRVISINPKDINNMLIISPPKELPGGSAYIKQADKDNALDEDALLFEELIQEYLEDELAYSQLDINYLDTDFLGNILDLTMMLVETSSSTKIDPVLPTIHSYTSYIQYSYNEEGIWLYAERPSHVSEITLDRYSNGYVNIKQDMILAPLQINEGGSDVVINITQSN